MPAKKCVKDGKDGWKWGDTGKCYTNEGSDKANKDAALRQGRAIQVNKSYGGSYMARELKDVEVQFVSYVDKAANKKKFFLLKSDNLEEPNFEKQVKILTKVDDPKKLVYGIVYTPDDIDSQGDFMGAEEIEKACHNFMKNFQKIDEQHDFTEGAGVLVECNIQLADIEVGEEVITKGTWVIVTEATDEIWGKIQKGEYTGYSLAGVAGKIESKKEKSFSDIILKYKNRSLETILKDFDSTMEDMKNTDVFLPLDILYRSILDSFWSQEDTITFKKEVKKICNQFLKYINSMTFEKVIKEEVEEKTKGEAMEKLEVQAMIDASLEPVIKSLGLPEGQTLADVVTKAIGEIEPPKPMVVLKDAEGKDIETDLGELVKNLVVGFKELKENDTIKESELSKKIAKAEKDLADLKEELTANTEIPDKKDDPVKKEESKDEINSRGIV